MSTLAAGIGDPKECRCHAKVYTVTIGNDPNVAVVEVETVAGEMYAVQSVRGCLTGQRIKHGVAKGMVAVGLPVFARHTDCLAKTR